MKQPVLSVPRHEGCACPTIHSHSARGYEDAVQYEDLRLTVLLTFLSDCDGNAFSAFACKGVPCCRQISEPAGTMIRNVPRESARTSRQHGLCLRCFPLSWEHSRKISDEFLNNQ